MIKPLLNLTARLPTPENFFLGCRIDGKLELPENILAFQRRGVQGPSAGNVHHRFLLSMNLGRHCGVLLDGARLIMPSESAILIHPYQHHLFIHDHPGIARLMISFELSRDSILPPPRNAMLTIGEEERQIAASILKSYMERKDPIEVSLSTALLLWALRRRAGGGGIARPPMARQPDIIDKVTRHIQKNLDSPLDIPTLAQRFNISASHLRMRFRRASGTSLGRYLIDSRLNRAMSLLAEGGLNVKEVAEKCGYASAFSFGHIFRKHAGVSPAKYRKMRMEGRQP